MVTPVVCLRLFEFLTTLTFGALRKKITLCQQHLRQPQKKGSLSTCGQQCIMNRQEYNRRWKGMLRGKKDLTSMAVPQNKTLSAIVHELHRRGFVSITVLINSKNTSAKRKQLLRLLIIRNLHPRNL